MTDPTFVPFCAYESARQSRWLVTCDHASNLVPPAVNAGTLGLPSGDMNRHIAYDLGAAGVTRALADALGAPAILSNFSRLVVDPNRGIDDPTILMKIYDGSVIEGNRLADEAEKARRIAAYYKPYHKAYAELAARRADTVIVAVHSFTPRLNGRTQRPWHIGILHEDENGLSKHFIDILNQEADLCVGDNEPYAGHLPGDALDQHAIKPGRDNTLIELRHDLIQTEAEQNAWGARLAPMLQAALEKLDATRK